MSDPRLFLEAFDETDAILAKQPYLLGDSPTRPDIPVAALLCPVVRPKEHPLPGPSTLSRSKAFVSS